MPLKFDSDLSSFSKAVTPFLEREATLHSFLRGIVLRFVETQKAMPLHVQLIDEEQKLIGVAIQTELNRPLIVSNLSTKAAQELANLLAENRKSLPGVTGPKTAVDGFTEAWCSLKRVQSKLYTNLRLFELTELETVKAPSGSARVARLEDADLIFNWLKAFHLEAVPNDPHEKEEAVRKSIFSAIEQKQFFFWDDGGQSVCWVASRRETEQERWIAPVYTPPEFRGRGYGTALTASVSKTILESGKKGMLFTDLSNPTSNSIYQKIGYQPVGDFKHIGFE